jgi:hypothetical protein
MRLTEIKREIRNPQDFTDEGIREDLEWQKWGFLMNAFHIMQLQGLITDEMFEECVESLMWFKPTMKD